MPTPGYVDLRHGTNGLCVKPVLGLTVHRKGQDFERAVQGRPTVLLGKSGNGAHGVRFITLFHELEHVAQTYMNPFLNSDKKRSQEDSLRRELQAYRIGAQISVGLYNSSQSRFSGDKRILSGTELAVERIRREANAGYKDPFKPNAAIIKKLAEVGIDEIIAR